MGGADPGRVGSAYCSARSPMNQAVDALGGFSIDEGGIFLIFLIHSAARCSDLSSCSMVTGTACLAAELTCVLVRAEIGSSPIARTRRSLHQPALRHVVFWSSPFRVLRHSRRAGAPACRSWS